MKRDLNDALDECLTLLQEEQTTLEACLARYPEHARDLRPLLETALEVSRLSPPTSSPATFAAGKQRMLNTLAEKRRRQAVSASPPARRVGWLATPFGKQARQAGSGYTYAFSRVVVAVAALVLLAIGSLTILHWPQTVVTQAATLEQVSGTVEILPANGETWHPAHAGQKVEAGDRVRTSPLSAARVTFFDGSTTNLEAETEVAVVQTAARRNGATAILLRQTLGQTYTHVQRLADRASRFEIETPTAVTRVRGTEFALAVEVDGTTHVTVIDGVVSVMANGVTVEVLAGQETTVQPGLPPAPARPAATPSPAPQPAATPAPTKTPTPPETARSTHTPAPANTPDSTTVPELIGTPQQDETPEPPGQTKTPQPPGLTKTPQPPGQTKTPQPPGQTKTPEPPGQAKPKKTPKSKKN